MELETNPKAEPSPEQQAAFEVYRERYEEFKTTGKLVVDGRPAEEWLGGSWQSMGVAPVDGQPGRR